MGIRYHPTQIVGSQGIDLIPLGPSCKYHGPKEKAKRVMSAPERSEVETLKVHCDGGKGALGHPRVYLNLGDKHFVDCPYCGHRFVLKEGAKISDAH